MNILKLTKIKIDKKTIANLSDLPGVYIFLSNGKVVYVGKAISLKRRLSSYLARNLGTKTSQMVRESDSLSTIKVSSELEALLLEASLIKKFQPKFNSASKDDKHPLYIRITDETYPRVITARKIEESPHHEKNLAFYGPFPSASSVYSVLRMLKRIFPFSDHKLGKRGCLHSHIGLCSPCPNEIERITNAKIMSYYKKEYLENISAVKQVLDGEIKTLARAIYRNMLIFSKRQKFEEALILKRKFDQLSYITQPINPVSDFLKNPNLLVDIRSEETQALSKIVNRFLHEPIKARRIECFDVSHLGGTSAAASMVTFIDGEPEKKLYRHFKIRIPSARLPDGQGKAGQQKGQDDLMSMKEVAKRRLAHISDWGKPDLIVVDGGSSQTSIFLKSFAAEKIPVVGLAKAFETLVIPTYQGSFIKYKNIKLDGPALNLVQRIRNEAHRFAGKYHHHLFKYQLGLTS